MPAYFNDGQRQATKDAGRIAGPRRDPHHQRAHRGGAGLRLRQATSSSKVAIYDLGGGTFDISILEIGNGVFEVISTAGDTFLGGEDFDKRIIDWLVAGFQREHKIDLRQDKMALQRLKDVAEKAKCELSTVRETEINLPFIISTGQERGAAPAAGADARASSRSLTDDLVERTVQICKKTLDEAGHREVGDRGRDPGRRHDAHAQGAGAGGRVLRHRALQGRAPRRGRGPGRGHPGLCAARREAGASCSSTSRRTRSAS